MANEMPRGARRVRALRLIRCYHTDPTEYRYSECACVSSFCPISIFHVAARIPGRNGEAGIVVGKRFDIEAAVFGNERTVLARTGSGVSGKWHCSGPEKNRPNM